MKKEIKVGTKVKMIVEGHIYSPIGSTGIICDGSCFHEGGVADCTGEYWITPLFESNWTRICIGGRENFKVLKY